MVISELGSRHKIVHYKTISPSFVLGVPEGEIESSLIDIVSRMDDITLRWSSSTGDENCSSRSKYEA